MEIIQADINRWVQEQLPRIAKFGNVGMCITAISTLTGNLVNQIELANPQEKEGWAEELLADINSSSLVVLDIARKDPRRKDNPITTR